MKRKLILISVILSLMLIILPACDMEASGSVKSLTKPYIGEYECVEARLGETDLLEKYESIKITLIDDKKLEISFKPVNGSRRAFEGEYSVDGETREFTGEAGILGYKFKEKAVIENGEFVISKLIMTKPLVMKFKMK
ncbi:MAG: hypothetical protein HFK03_04075 [Clostridia bacterium]|jgi:hypothetical protein|nr:hypothetical protein [Clostridia bacterium]